VIKKSGYSYQQKSEVFRQSDGSAVEGVCVSGAVNRLIVLFVSKEGVTVASRYGAVFAK
jgi:hypothetical protein